MPLKIIYMGTPDFAVIPFMALLQDSDFEILAVVTQPDKKVGRKQVLTPTPLKVAAQEADIPVLQPEKLKNNPEFLALVKKMEPDLLVVVAYGQILPPEFLEIPRYGSVNIHPSLLPEYRGPTPMISAIADGKTETGITFMLLEEKMDAGPVLFVERAEIKPEDNTLTLRERLFQRAGALLPAVLKDFADGLLTPLPQNDSKATYCQKFTKEDGRLDPQKMSARNMWNRIRAYTPHAFLEVDGKKLKILEAVIDLSDSSRTTSFSPNPTPPSHQSTSSPTATSPSNAPTITSSPSPTKPSALPVTIPTKEGLLYPTKVQPEGKKPMSIQDFARGNAEIATKIGLIQPLPPMDG